ncbi:MAG: TROVE domain-containing protein [Gemmatirosa sp.]|nr:TROVE domain-containing protein [Gemmatirosa sp.]
MFDFTQHAAHLASRLRRHATPQSEPIPGTTQVPNSAGGHAWAVDHWARLDRFLVLGSEGGTFYVGERPLTRESATAAAACVAEDGARVVRRIVEISAAGRAPRNDPALFVLAMTASADDRATRAAALTALPQVARTGTHLFHFLRYLQSFRGWGRGVRSAVGRWYTHRAPGDLAYQLLKYQARDGWSHRDALRLAHPTAPDATHDLLFRYVVKGWDGVGERPDGVEAEVAERLAAVHAIRGTTPADAANLIRVYRLTREMVPTHLLGHAAVWEALLEEMPLGALVRSLGVMSKVGLLAPGSDAARTVAARLGDADAIRRARLHPLGILAALRTYAQGGGIRGRHRWAPVASVVDALDAAFYLAFGNVPSTGRRLMLALDVSGSMGSAVHGLPFVSCREAAAAMALVTAAREPSYHAVAFTAGDRPSMHAGYPTGLTALPLSPRQRLDDVVRRTAALPFGGTDCALPMLEALRHGWAVDAFVVYTDSETWAGEVHPAQALRAYRERTGIAAKLVVVAMASNGFSIADPADAGMLDVVGFDAATPQVISEFVSG